MTLTADATTKKNSEIIGRICIVCHSKKRKKNIFIELKSRQSKDKKIKNRGKTNLGTSKLHALIKKMSQKATIIKSNPHRK